MADSKTKDSAQEINIEELVAKYVDQYENIIASKIDNEFFLYRVLGRAEYKAIYEDEQFTQLEKENLVVQTCLVYPEHYDLDDCPAGTPTQLCKEILEASLITDKETLCEILDAERLNFLSDENNILNCMILSAFPSFDLEEVENWPMEKAIKYYTRAEWILSNLQGIKIEKYNTFLEKLALEQQAKEREELEKHKEELEQKPQTTIRGGDKKNKLTPDKLKEREEFLKKFPEFANDNVLANGIDGLEQSDVDTMSPALRPGY